MMGSSVEPPEHYKLVQAADDADALRRAVSIYFILRPGSRLR